MSSRDMTINQIKAADKEFGATHTIPVKGFNKRDGGNHSGRKSGSKNKLSLMSLNKKLNSSISTLDKKIDKIENAVNEHKTTIASVNSKVDKLSIIVEQLVKKVDEGFARQEQFNQKQLEFNQFVINQFKKHGWVD